MAKHFETKDTPWEFTRKVEKRISDAKFPPKAPPPEKEVVIPTAAQIMAGEYTIDQLLTKQKMVDEENETKERKESQTPRKNPRTPRSDRDMREIHDYEKQKLAHQLAPTTPRGGTPRKGTPPRKSRPQTPPRRPAPGSGGHQHQGKSPAKKGAGKAPAKRGTIQMKVPEELLRFSASKKGLGERPDSVHVDT